MSTVKRNYDSTVARMAGNIAGNMLDRVLVVRAGDHVTYSADTMILIARDAVMLAGAIVAETARTEPQ